MEPIFEQLGVVDQVNTAGFLRHTGHRIRWEGDQPERFEAFGQDEHGAWKGYQAWRPELDQILLKHAEDKGVVVWQPCRALDVIEEGGRVIGLDTQHGRVYTEFVLDATGQSRWLSRKLDIGWTVCSPQMIARYGYVKLLPKDREPFENPWMHRDETGWTWTAMVRTELCAWVRLSFGGSDPGPEWVPHELKIGRVIESGRGADVTWRIADNLAGPGWSLVGDAAVVMDPAASHGVLRALMSGMKAASLIADCREGWRTSVQAIQEYNHWLRLWFDSDVTRLNELYELGQGHV